MEKYELKSIAFNKWSMNASKLLDLFDSVLHHNHIVSLDPMELDTGTIYYHLLLSAKSQIKQHISIIGIDTYADVVYLVDKDVRKSKDSIKAMNISPISGGRAIAVVLYETKENIKDDEKSSRKKAKNEPNKRTDADSDA